VDAYVPHAVSGGGAAAITGLLENVRPGHRKAAYDSTVAVSSDELAALRRRDEAALRAVVDEHSARLYRAARGMGHSADEADDLVQDVFLTFVSSIDRFEGRSALHTWLYGILLHKVREGRRRRARDAQHDAIEEEWESRFDAAGNWIHPPVDPDRSLSSKELGRAIEACLEALPEQQREVFQLRQVEELAAVEAGKVLDLTVTHIGVLLHRARLRLRRCLDGHGWRTSR
jgi:RNA polymerase sigma-70 factor (ECF subfamily)